MDEGKNLKTRLWLCCNEMVSRMKNVYYRGDTFVDIVSTMTTQERKNPALILNSYELVLFNHQL